MFKIAIVEEQAFGSEFFGDSDNNNSNDNDLQ